jgi:hypothetical protein
LRGLPSICDGIPDDDLTLDWRIRLLAREGDVDGAYRLLEQPLPNSRGTTMFLFYPEMRGVRRDKRFFALAQRLGLLAYWKSTDDWPDFCQLDGLTDACGAAIGARAPSGRLVR